MNGLAGIGAKVPGAVGCPRIGKIRPTKRHAGIAAGGTIRMNGGNAWQRRAAKNILKDTAVPGAAMAGAKVAAAATGMAATVPAAAEATVAKAMAAEKGTESINKLSLERCGTRIPLSIAHYSRRLE